MLYFVLAHSCAFYLFYLFLILHLAIGNLPLITFFLTINGDNNMSSKVLMYRKLLVSA